MRERVFSGVQPTGNIHLGNYLGALKQWVGLQDQYECLFGIMDLHGLTVPPVDPQGLRESVRSTFAMYLAVGVDLERSTLFVQSALPWHGYLSWILGCLTPMGFLNRMTQFKDKSSKRQETHLGLYAYPVLMAADVLLYKAHKVPVGEDQKQHIELMREVARIFNHTYAKNLFIIPEVAKMKLIPLSFLSPYYDEVFLTQRKFLVG